MGLPSPNDGLDTCHEFLGRILPQAQVIDVQWFTPLPRLPFFDTDIASSLPVFPMPQER